MSVIKKFSDRFSVAKETAGAIVGMEFEFYSNHSYYKTLELLNVRLRPVNVHGVGQYHSDLNVDADNFKIEPDMSGGPDMVELITGPMEYHEAKNMLVKCLRFIRENGYTDDRCSVHINISFRDKKMSSLNKLKLLLDFNENYVYEKFPDRIGNVYARSVKNIIPFKFWNSDVTSASLLLSSIELPEDTKYYGINISDTTRGWIEFRYVGGEKYETKQEDIMDLMDYFIIQTYNSISVPMDQSHDIILNSYLSKNMADYTKFKSYEDFVSLHDDVIFTVDKDDDINLCRAFYDKCSDTVFDLYKNAVTGSVTINYDSDTNAIEVVGADIKGTEDIKGVMLIDCSTAGCTIMGCRVYNCDVKTSHVVSCDIRGCTVTESKLTNCTVSGSEIVDSFMTGGSLKNSEMTGGVFRAGKLLDGANISQSVRTDVRSEFWLDRPEGSKKQLKPKK